MDGTVPCLERVPARASLLRAQLAHPQGLWGAILGHVMAFTQARVNAWTVGLLSLTPTDEVLDLGFGPGLGVRYASQVAARVYGVDHSKVMLRQATRRNARAIEAGRVVLAQQMNVPDASIDKAFSVDTVQLVEDVDAHVRDLYRVLRPSGVAAVAVQCPGMPGWIRRVERAMEEAGFETVSNTYGARESMLCITGRKAGISSGN